MNALLLLISPFFWLVVALISSVALWPAYRRAIREEAGQLKWLAVFIFFWTNSTAAIAFSIFTSCGTFKGAPPLEAAVVVLAIFLAVEGSITTGLALWFWPGYRQLWHWLGALRRRPPVMLGL